MAARAGCEGLAEWLRAGGARWEGFDWGRGGASGDGAFCVRALRAVRVGEEICQIPKRLCLTPVTSGAAGLLLEEGVGGTLAVVFAVMYELARGAQSPWHGYLRTLPEMEPLPIFWSSEDVELLAGTEMEEMLDTDLALMRQDYDESVAPILKRHPELDGPGMSFEAFQRAASLVASRAFYVDSAHGEGMVPLADMFNHRTGKEHVHFCAESDSEEEDSDEGDSGERGGDGREGGEEERGEVEEGKEAVQPEGDGETARQGKERKDVLTMVVVRDAEEGEELFNTFGMHGNAALLHKYGFAEPDNCLNTVKIDAEMLEMGFEEEVSLSIAEDLFKDRDMQELYEISPEGEIEKELLMVAHFGCLSSEARRKLTERPGAGAYAALDAMTESELLGHGPEFTGPVLAYVISLLEERRGMYAWEGTAEQDFERMRAEMPSGSGALGCTGRAAAYCLSGGEKKVLEKAFVRLLQLAKEGLGAAKGKRPAPGGSDTGNKKRGRRGTVSGAPYDPVVRLG